jgi:hypothetical protein
MLMNKAIFWDIALFSAQACSGMSVHIRPIRRYISENGKSVVVITTIKTKVIADCLKSSSLHIKRVRKVQAAVGWK